MNTERTDWTDSEEGSRVQLKKDYFDDPQGMAQSALARNKTLVSYMQSEAPEREDELQPASAAETILQSEGVNLFSDKQKGIQDSSMKQIWDRPGRGELWAACAKEIMLARFNGRNDITTNLDFAVTDYTPGSAFRPYSTTELRNPNPLVSFPPLSAVVGSVRVQDSDIIEIPEKVPNAAGENPVKWNEGDEPNLSRLTLRKSDGDSEYLQGGFELTKSLRNSSVGSEAVIMEMDVERLRGERVLVNEAIALIAGGLTAVDAGIGSGADPVGADTIADIAMSFTEHDFAITTLVGLQDVVKRFLLADRSGFFHYGGPQNTSQSILGTDTYGKSGMGRMVYDMVSARLPANVVANTLLGWDSRVTADVFMAAGTEENVDVYDAKTGVYTLLWRFKYGVTLRTPLLSTSRRLFS